MIDPTRVESLAIERVDRVREIAPDDVEPRIDRYIGEPFVSAEDLRGPAVGRGWQVVHSRSPKPGFTIIVGFGVDAVTAKLQEAGIDLVDGPAIYPEEAAEAIGFDGLLGLDRTNEVLVVSDDQDLLSRALTRTPIEPSIVDIEVLRTLLDVAGSAEEINLYRFDVSTDRYPQHRGVLSDTHTVLPNGNLDECLLLPYENPVDAETAGQMLVDDIAAGAGDLDQLANVEVATDSTVVTLCQRDQSNPQLVTYYVFEPSRDFPPFA